jgi:manganese-dependent inorganic pyrophosphatase
MSKKITERLRKSDIPAAPPPRIIIIGHKNPDTDSIAAAAGYAELKRLLGVPNVIAACAGLPSKRTEFLFSKFNVPLPIELADVFPRVRDVVDRNPPTLSAGQTLLEAFSMLQRTRRHRIPLINQKGIYLGMVSLFDLADRMIIQAQGSEGDFEGLGAGLVGREINTSIAHIVEVLKATALSLHREGIVETMQVYVGAMSEMSLRERMSKRDPRKVALVVGDRAEIQEVAVEFKLRLMIVTGNHDLDPKLIERARANGTSILQTPFDSGTTVRRMKFSAPAELMLQDDVPTFGMEEKLSEVRDAITGEREQIFPVIDDRGKFEGVLTREGLERELPVKLILVDHNELTQAIDGAAEVPIMEVLDHHRLGAQQTQVPITFINEVVGSSCTLVTEQFRRFGVTPSMAMAGILMGGVITDTLMLRSPTTTPRDEAVIQYLQEIAETDGKALSEEILSVGSSIASQPPRNVITADKKDYETAKYKFAVAQVEEVGFENFIAHRAELLREMRQLRREEEFDLFALLVTNVVRETSMMLCVGEKRVLDRISYTRLDESTFDLPGVMSRKKQLLPHLLKVMS